MLTSSGTWLSLSVLRCCLHVARHCDIIISICGSWVELGDFMLNPYLSLMISLYFWFCQYANYK